MSAVKMGGRVGLYRALTHDVEHKRLRWVRWEESFFDESYRGTFEDDCRNFIIVNHSDDSNVKDCSYCSRVVPSDERRNAARAHSRRCVRDRSVFEHVYEESLSTDFLILTKNCDLSDMLKRVRSFEEISVSKQAAVEAVRQHRLIDSLQTRIKELEEQLHLERQLSYQALREQDRAFSEWQRSIERASTPWSNMSRHNIM